MAIRELGLSNLISRLQINGIPKDKYDNFLVQFEETKLFDMIFGDFTNRQDNTDAKSSILVVKTKNARSVLGGTSAQSISRNLVSGMIINGDGTVTIDMNTDWIVSRNITVNDFLTGKQRFFKTTDAVKFLGFKTNSAITDNRHFDDYKLKVGRVWLIEYDAVLQYRDNREITLRKSQPSLRVYS